MSLLPIAWRGQAEQQRRTVVTSTAEPDAVRIPEGMGGDGVPPFQGLALRGDVQDSEGLWICDPSQVPGCPGSPGGCLPAAPNHSGVKQVSEKAPQHSRWGVKYLYLST